MLTLNQLKAHLHYNPETGQWTHLLNGLRHKAGERADYPRSANPDDYRRVRVGGKRYYAHVLAWFYMRGEWPRGLIDHRNLKKGENRWGNLREATHPQNLANSLPRSRNKSGFKGVHWHAGAGKWRAMIFANGRDRHLGYFDSPEAAAIRYSAEARIIYGEYARA